MKARTLPFLFLFFLAAIFAAATASAEIQVSPSSVVMDVGTTSILTVSNAYGSVSAISHNTTVLSASYANLKVTLKGLKAGSTSVTVRDSNSSKEISVIVKSTSTGGTTTPTGSYTLLAWNDLGMHCVDGKDYSVFSILPPYNNLHAQLVNTATGKAVSSNVTLSYEAVADSTGSINTTSSNKTNFWQYVGSIFGVNLANDVGLTGNPMASAKPAAMQYNATYRWFEADGIPITPVDDQFNKNFYPMVKVVARDLSGKELASTRTVLPVSDEMTCKACHASTTDTGNPAITAAKPAAGWVFDADQEKDWKKNILLLHDEKKLNNSAFAAALIQLGYSPAGLSATAQTGKPVLCAACHSSNALPGTGVAGITPLTQALHTRHATVKDPATQLSLGDSTNRTSCYMCHPGSETQCLRGAMGNALDTSGQLSMNCQSCHGSMQAVGSAARVGWLQQPTCQSCHHDGKREVSGVDANGVVKTWADQRFASNPNTPAAGYNLYRFSKGHGNLQCESCHGATHAEYPSSHVNDNVQSLAVQGHTGTINECTACHKTVPLTTTGGPHGLHTIGQSWVSEHEHAAEAGTAACTYCHGADYRGTALSEVKVAKTFTVEGRTKSFAAGQKVGCYDCHNGPHP
jgi:hypothetical protein